MEVAVVLGLVWFGVISVVLFRRVVFVFEQCLMCPVVFKFAV